MSDFVRSWIRHGESRSDNENDGIDLGEEGKRIMASRKSPQTDPVNDNSAGEESVKTSKALPENQLVANTNMILERSREEASTIRALTFSKLEDLGVKRQLKKAASFDDRHSVNGDVGSLISWIRKIEPEDDDCIEQLVIIDATCCKRVGG